MTMKQVRVGIVGFGTVGRATADIIEKHRDLIAHRSGVTLTVTAVCRRSNIAPASAPSNARVYSDWKQLLQDPNVDVVVETMGGTGDSLQLVRGALEQGKPVVTANKNLLASHGDELFSLAVARNLPIGFEASVAGGIPILRVIHESTAGDRLRSVHGILNGTANYILTQMESRGIEFAEALAEAQKAGFAEADPSFDIDGQDARDKLCILARMAFEGGLDVTRIPDLRHPPRARHRHPLGHPARKHDPPRWLRRSRPTTAWKSQCAPGWSAGARCLRKSRASTTPYSSSATRSARRCSTVAALAETRPGRPSSPTSSRSPATSPPDK